jgi:hypothetical protein
MIFQRNTGLFRGVLIAAAAAIPIAGAACQTSPPVFLKTCDKPAPGLGSISGTLIADSADVGVRRGVYVSDPWCSVLSDESGRFEMSGLPPGTYHLEVGSLGIRHVKPIEVRVEADHATRLEIHLQPENLVLDCLADSVCAAVISPIDSELRGTLSDAAQLLEAALRTTIAISGTFRGLGTEGAICVGVGHPSHALPARLLAALKRRVPAARDPSECVQADTSSHLSDLATRNGDRAASVTVSTGGPTGDHAVLDSQEYVGPLSAAGYLCTYRRTSRGWVPTTCRLTWIS